MVDTNWATVDLLWEKHLTDVGIWVWCSPVLQMLLSKISYIVGELYIDNWRGRGIFFVVPFGKYCTRVLSGSRIGIFFSFRSTRLRLRSTPTGCTRTCNAPRSTEQKG